MLAPAPRLTAYDNRPTWRTRLAAVLLSLGMVVTIVATMIAMGLIDTVPGGKGERLSAVTMSSSNQEERKQQRQKATDSAAPQVNLPVMPVPPHLPKPAIISKVPPVQMIPMSKADMAASDISKLGRSAGNSSASGNSAGAYGPGEGPGGARLYNAEWYREPSDAEIGGYLPGAVPPGAWGMIACKTIANNRVENCMQLGESPPGSGLARALRLASWQFLVRPPRIDGKPVIGAWVRIRFDFTKGPRGDGEGE